MTRLIILFVFISTLPLTGCATIVEGNDQSVSISTPGAEGAICTLQSPAIGSLSITTPDTVLLTKSKHDIAVECKKDCYESVSGIIPSSFEGMTAGNIIFGGVIGVAVDASSGAMNKYQPSISLPMNKKPSC